ncbi:unnamed protein product [Schistocephalus solidus]|uniref:Reverse transcriptase domain-containing protein n=1 Tax=Schistocephalus solidus TaxID=70667 RepID=A0A3P7CKA2_SCHSO|nr:unnamed protein product [Schistocephalus solidus]
MLNIAGKIFARILLNRLNGHLEQGLLPESQCGFRRHRGTIDMIFAATLAFREQSLHHTLPNQLYSDWRRQCKKSAFGFFQASTPRATVTTGGLNQVRVSSDVCASTPDNPRSNRPERRTELVARELARYKVEIAALSETRFSEQRQLEEVGAGYTFFWSGRPNAEQRDACVAFAIRNDIVGCLPCLPQGINGCLMSLYLPFQGDQFATIISAYATPITSSDAAKDKFYEDLHALQATVSNVDKWDPSQVCWYAQGRLRSCQPPVPSPISCLLDTVMTLGSGGGGGDCAVDSSQVYYRLKLIHAQVTVPAPPGVEHTVDLVVIDG